MVEREKLVSMVCAVQQGKEGAADALYESFYSDIYYYIMKTVNDPELAADLTQDTFIEILNTIGNLKEPAAFVTWSKQIAYHRCTAHFKKRRELLADEDADGHSVFDTITEDREEFIPDEALDKADLRQIIHAMINTLPEEQRAAIMMRYFDELSIAEIAQIQSVSEGTVKSRLNYGRKAIKQSVENYEKQNNIKLHCAGVIPLLLWLFKGSKYAEGISLTTQGISAASYAEGVATAAKASSAGASTTSSAVSSTAKIPRIKKIIAGIAAAAVVTGGTVVGLLPKSAKDPSCWVGYGSVLYEVVPSRFELAIDQQNNDMIIGHLEVSQLYDVRHDAQFKGSGTEEDGKITYTITFDMPLVGRGILQSEFFEAKLIYSKDTATYALDGIYDVDLNPVWEGKKEEILAEKAVWSGHGTDMLYYSPFHQDGHLFTIEVYQMTQTEIAGKMTVSYQEQIDHVSEFTGRGFLENNQILFEIKLKQPRQEEQIITLTVDNFWMIYDMDTDSFEISSPCLYQVTASREK